MGMSIEEYRHRRKARAEAEDARRAAARAEGKPEGKPKAQKLKRPTKARLTPKWRAEIWRLHVEGLAPRAIAFKLKAELKIVQRAIRLETAAEAKRKAKLISQ
ncbi:hypothetical protein HLH89_28705 [Rhizobium laguerreae]|uniref:hypothetical protein n=1 Tax=Rhizobium laguerreae TaxID=1076926 RepID=UPI0014788E46|nr:hypothetical protein [Rhizobium laguerreae]NNH84979.1 hypothetical protein [Rhizobium laguerreae]